jgi:hypothetical protein
LRFKIDQNLPVKYTALLRQAGFEADTVEGQLGIVERDRIRYRED